MLRIAVEMVARMLARHSWCKINQINGVGGDDLLPWICHQRRGQESWILYRARNRNAT